MRHWYLGLVAVLMVVVIMPFAYGGNTEQTPNGGPCGLHKGLACAAGADTDGSVICLDGYRDMDVSYASACGAVSLPVPERPAFVGTPKTREDLADCKVVGMKLVNKYFLKGDSAMSDVSLNVTQCFANVEAAKAAGFVAGR